MKFMLLLLALTLPTAFAEDMEFDKKGHLVPTYVGEVKSFRGKLYKKNPQGRMLEVKPGTRFYKSDTLVTEEKSFAKLLIVDDTQLTVGPKTELNFEDFKFSTKTERKILYSLVQGQLRGDVKNKAKDDDVVIKTKNATLGVRGTKILVNHRTLNNLEVSEFALESGSAVVTDNVKKVKHDILKGERVVVLQDSVTNEYANEKNKLFPSDIDTLKNDEDFMPYYDLPSVQESSTLFTLLTRQNTGDDQENEAERGKQNKKDSGSKGTLHNLDKLNEKLRENQKQRK